MTKKNRPVRDEKKKTIDQESETAKTKKPQKTLEDAPALGEEAAP